MKPALALPPSKYGKIEICLDPIKKSATVTAVHSRTSSSISLVPVVMKEKKVNFMVEENKSPKKIKNMKTSKKGKKIVETKERDNKKTKINNYISQVNVSNIKKKLG